MRRFASAVTVVSVRSGQERHGTTATAVTSISMDPPSLLVCFNRESRLHGFLSKESRFCVNLLHTDNCEISRSFASPMSADERFASGDWRDRDGIPYLANAQANFFCSKNQEISYGSHTVFMARDADVFFREEVDPLLYGDGAYAKAVNLQPQATTQA